MPRFGRTAHPALQGPARESPLPDIIDAIWIVVVTTAIVAATYQGFVRYSWIGRMLNGPRDRAVDEARKRRERGDAADTVEGR